jgi:glucokinase
MTYLLAGDIGGTKTLLRLVHADSPDRLEFEHSYSSQAYPDLVPIVREFFSAAHTQLGTEIKVASACFGIAGPVKDGVSPLTNLNWHLIAERLQVELQIPQVELINDFAAIGYGIPLLTASDLYTLQIGQIRANAPKAIIGAGTGLGEGFLIHDGTGYLVIATEGGHTDYAARSIQEFEFVQYMCERHQLDRLSYDRVVSGSGIVAFYQFLRDISKLSENPDIASVVKLWEQQTDKSADPAALISAAAIGKTDLLAQTTMELFMSAYGAEAGNLALKILPYGGLYIAGGIAAKNIPLLTDGTFVTAFNHKGRMSELLGTMPIYVVLNPQVGLLGAVARAASLAGISC